MKTGSGFFGVIAISAYDGARVALSRDVPLALRNELRFSEKTTFSGLGTATDRNSLRLSHVAKLRVRRLRSWL